MTKPSKIIVGCVLGALLALILLYEFRWKEPSYQGRSLGEWLAYADSAPPERQAEAIAAVQRMGKRALPHAFAMLRATDSPFGDQVIKFMNEHTVLKIKPAVPAERVRERGLVALVALRSQEPKMITHRLAQELEVDNSHIVILPALAHMGTNGLPLLVQALTNRLPEIRRSAAIALCLPQWWLSDSNRDYRRQLEVWGMTRNEIRDNSKSFSTAAIPWLLRCLNDSDPAVRWVSAIALESMGERPTNAIPIFVAGLSAEYAGDRRAMAIRLGHFGKAAAEAVPVLVQLLDDQDEEVRSAAKRALKEIGATVLDEHPAAP